MMPEAEDKVPERIWVTISANQHRVSKRSTGETKFYKTGYWTSAPSTPRPEYVTAASRDAAVREALEAAAREVLDWQGRIMMGHPHANAVHDETLSRISTAIRALIPGDPA